MSQELQSHLPRRPRVSWSEPPVKQIIVALLAEVALFLILVGFRCVIAWPALIYELLPRFGKFRFSKGNTESSSVHTLPVFVTKAVVSSTSAFDCSSPTLYTHASYAASMSSRDPSSPTNSEFYSFSVRAPAPPQPALGELPPTYDSQHRSSTTTTASSVVPQNPSPFLVPFDFENQGHPSADHVNHRSPV